jgi:hypothetical protein
MGVLFMMLLEAKLIDLVELLDELEKEGSITNIQEVNFDESVDLWTVQVDVVEGGPLCLANS